jgi:hypothetical protein
VVYYGLAVGADLQVGLDAVITATAAAAAPAYLMMPRAASCSPRWAIGWAVSQAGLVVRNWTTLQADYDTRKVPSTSTAASAGSSDADGGTGVAALVAEHRHHEVGAPFITLGPSKSAVN